MSIRVLTKAHSWHIAGNIPRVGSVQQREAATRGLPFGTNNSTGQYGSLTVPPSSPPLLLFLRPYDPRHRTLRCTCPEPGNLGKHQPPGSELTQPRFVIFQRPALSCDASLILEPRLAGLNPSKTQRIYPIRAPTSQNRIALQPRPSTSLATSISSVSKGRFSLIIVRIVIPHPERTRPGNLEPWTTQTWPSMAIHAVREPQTPTSRLWITTLETSTPC